MVGVVGSCFFYSRGEAVLQRRLPWRPWTNSAEGQHMLQPKAEGHVLMLPGLHTESNWGMQQLIHSTGSKTHRVSGSFQ